MCIYSRNLERRIFLFKFLVVKLGICKAYYVVPECRFHIGFARVNSWTGTHFPGVTEWLYSAKFSPPPTLLICMYGEIGWDVLSPT